MKNVTRILSVAGVSLLGFNHANAQEPNKYERKGYTLTYTSNDPTLDPGIERRLVETFFNVYPKLAKEYNKAASKTVAFVVDTAYKGVAATGDGRIVYNPDWFKKHPEDIDVVTHEGMHVVQDYKHSVGPGWLTEGIADYARNQFGVNNAAAKWALPDFKPTQNYTNSYRVTARFLVWLEKKQKKGIVKELDKQLRDHTYTADTWKKQTGKTLDELWKLYSESPAI
ncbi:basic secretory protein-like protein [Mucilaginibacter terrae]|uniref:Secretory protein n=1 Tax=Mucilaginibacter terrae TaxID=1955052 RepID=A0ABU3GRY1_9SPHI|nr:basic secretory protein-like protein [Mucilaginibacter terrae]MDT3402544.1 hypothetical protein [Mucilaginibacter terrae]